MDMRAGVLNFMDLRLFAKKTGIGAGILTLTGGKAEVHTLDICLHIGMLPFYKEVLVGWYFLMLGPLGCFIEMERNYMR